MTTNGTNPGMSVDDYENMAVQKSNVAKRVAAGAAVFVGGAAVAGGAAYAANQTDDTTDETPLTEEDIVNGAGVGDTYKQETQEVQTTERVVYVDRPEQPSKPEHTDDDTAAAEDETKITWDETTDYYVDGNKMGSIEEGTIDGHKFMLVDNDGDSHADYLAIDVNDDGRFDSDEVVAYSPSDHVHMGHDTAHTTEKYYSADEINGTDNGGLAQNDNNGGNVQDDNNHGNGQNDMIHNNFEDEKTGESYNGDYAQNNPDYNPHGQVDDYDAHNDNYLADNNGYDTDDAEYHSAGIDGTGDDNELALHDYNDDDTAGDDMAQDDTIDVVDDATDGYDSMDAGEEYLA